MCSRYSLTSPPEAVRATFGYRGQPNFPPRYNIAPTQPIPIVRLDPRGQREFVLVRWGLIPSWVKDPKDFATLINARAETAAEKPSFRNAMKRRRCLIPADGFYEWTGARGRKRPFYIHPEDGRVLAFAGLWEHWQGPDGSELESATILTTEANAVVAPLHARMPVILPEDAFDAWLDAGRVPPSELAEFLEPAPDALLAAIEVDPKLNNSRVDEPGVRVPLQGQLL
ncbi:MAG: SOS response-associated peptidase [Methyloligellaceae bacterium]